MKRKGNAGENRVAAEERHAGALVASLRETEGGGDLLVVRMLVGAARRGQQHVVQLVEVKANRTGGPFSNFRRPERDALSKLARKHGASAWLAYAPPGRETQWIHEADWPRSGGRRART